MKATLTAVLIFSTIASNIIYSSAADATENREFPQVLFMRTMTNPGSGGHYFEPDGRLKFNYFDPEGDGTFAKELTSADKSKLYESILNHGDVFHDSPSWSSVVETKLSDEVDTMFHFEVGSIYNGELSGDRKKVFFKKIPTNQTSIDYKDYPYAEIHPSFWLYGAGVTVEDSEFSNPSTKCSGTFQDEIEASIPDNFPIPSAEEGKERIVEVMIRYKQDTDESINWDDIEPARVVEISEDKSKLTLLRDCSYAKSWNKLFSSKLSRIKEKKIYIAPHVNYWSWPTGYLTLNFAQVNDYYKIQQPWSSSLVAHNARTFFIDFFHEFWSCRLGQTSQSGINYLKTTDSYCDMSSTRRVDVLQADGARWRPDQGGNGKVSVDANNDGIDDYGYISGEQIWGQGFAETLDSLRSSLQTTNTSIFFNVDSSRPSWGYRGLFSQVDGIEIENFLEIPSGIDLKDWFSSYFQHLAFWSEGIIHEGHNPALSYPVTKSESGTFNPLRSLTGLDETTITIPLAKIDDLTVEGSRENDGFRVGLASSLLLGLPHAYAMDTGEENKQYFGFYPWDEYFNGTDNTKHWLGNAISTRINKSDLLDSEALVPKYEQNIVGERCVNIATTSSGFSSKEMLLGTTKNNEELLDITKSYKYKVSSVCDVPEVEDGGMSFSIKTALSSSSWTVKLQMRAESLRRHFNNKYPRLVRIQLVNDANEEAYHDVLVDGTQRDFALSFNFKSNVKPLNLNIFSGAEKGSLLVSNDIKLFKGSYDRWVRFFDNGFVLLNISPDEWKVSVGDLMSEDKSLSPSKAIKSLQKICGQSDPIVNNCAVISDSANELIVVPSNDAVFIKVKREGVVIDSSNINKFSIKKNR